MSLQWILLMAMMVVSYSAMVGAHIGPRGIVPDCNSASAICKIYNGSIEGVIQLTTVQKAYSLDVSVKGEIRGLSPGLHGFHVHQYGDLSNGCAGAGAHYNPFNKHHGAPTDTDRHLGDLGNVNATAEGVAHIEIVDSQLKLCGPYSIMGRSIVVHANGDDLGKGGNDDSLKTGNSGARIGCCVIGTAPVSN